MAGCGGAMERGDSFPAMDRVGESRFWRAEIYFLSAAFVDAGGRARVGNSLERRADRVYCAGANGGGIVRVCADAQSDVVRCGAFWRGLLCGESVCAARD